MAASYRADAVLLARLRAGHTPLLKAYANLLDPSADPPVSPLQRGAADDQTLATEVPQARRTWAKHIWKSFSTPKVLTADPERVLARAMVTLG